MKAKIDRNGILKVERAGEMKTQCCPYTPGNYTSYCGDWCPKFDERVRGHFDNGPYEGGKYIHDGFFVTVCGGPTYEIVADERTKGSDNASE